MSKRPAFTARRAALKAQNDNRRQERERKRYWRSVWTDGATV